MNKQTPVLSDFKYTSICTEPYCRLVSYTNDNPNICPYCYSEAIAILNKELLYAPDGAVVVESINEQMEFK